MRWIWPLALALASAFATLALVGPRTAETDSAATAPNHRPSEASATGASSVPTQTIIVPTPRPTSGLAPRLFERQRMALEDPARGLYTWNEGIERALSRAAREIAERDGVGPFQCFAGLELVGRQVLELAVEVEATETHLAVSGMRYVRQVDGTPIPDDAGRCWAEFFAGRHEVDAEPDGPGFLPMNRTVEYVLDFTIEAP